MRKMSFPYQRAMCFKSFAVIWYTMFRKSMTQPHHKMIKRFIFFKTSPPDICKTADSIELQSKLFTCSLFHGIQYFIRISITTNECQCQMQIFLFCIHSLHAARTQFIHIAYQFLTHSLIRINCNKQPHLLLLIEQFDLFV